MTSRSLWTMSRQLQGAWPRSRTPSLTSRRNASVTNAEPLVLTETFGNVFTIAINRATKRNCVNPATARQLVQAFQEFENNKDLWVAVLYGKGGCFCAGYDLTTVAGTAENDDIINLESQAQNLLDPKQWRLMGPSMMPFSKPVIGAISGYAVAGGLELALMCDLRVVEESAIMGVYCRRFGIPLIDGGTVRLPQLIGLSRALDVILTGRPIDAAEAKDMGIANRIAPDGTAVGQALKLAQELCKFPQLCMRADRKSAFYSTYDAASTEDAFKYELQGGHHVIHKESVQGAKRFQSGVGKHGSFDLRLPKHKL